MASSNQTLGDEPLPFEVDTTERTHTIQGVPGGRISNIDKSAGGGATIYIQPNDSSVTAADGGSVPVPIGTSYQLPVLCRTFRAKTAAGNSYAQLEK